MKPLSPLARAIAYIEAHLEEDISLSDVSREIGYSYYHMTRLFTAVLGEAPGHYINRRRLSNAAERLLYSDQRVLDIALDCGYQSAEAFSRAFKAALGQSPQAYRRAGLHLVTNAKPPLDAEALEHIACHLSLTPEIVQREAVTVAGIRANVALTNNRLPELWACFLRLYEQYASCAGIGYSVCETLQTCYTKEGDVAFSVLVGAASPCLDELPPALARKTLSAGRYAVFTHHGALHRLFTTYQYIYGTWLATTKETLADREDFEMYPRPLRSPLDPDNEVKIFIPIQEEACL